VFLDRGRGLEGGIGGMLVVAGQRGFSGLRGIPESLVNRGHGCIRVG